MRRAVAILLVLPALAGCTQTSAATENFEGEEKRIAQVVVDLSDDAARGKQAEVCDQRLSTALRDKVAGDGTCAEELEKAFGDAGGAVLEVEDVTVTGSTAIARVSSEDRDRTVTRSFKLVKESQRWRIDSFG